MLSFTPSWFLPNLYNLNLGRKAKSLILCMLDWNKQCRRYRRCGFDCWVRKIPWRRKWQPIPVFLPGEFHGQRSLADYSPWGRQESDMTEQLTHTQTGVWTLHSWCRNSGFEFPPDWVLILQVVFMLNLAQPFLPGSMWSPFCLPPVEMPLHHFLDSFQRKLFHIYSSRFSVSEEGEFRIFLPLHL